MNDADAAIAEIRRLASIGEYRITVHGHEEMAAESIRLDDLLHAIATGSIIEDYPTHRRGPCCLLYGKDANGRDVHVVCTSGAAILVIITVYLPRPPKWLSPTQRRPAP